MNANLERLLRGNLNVVRIVSTKARPKRVYDFLLVQYIVSLSLSILTAILQVTLG